MTGPRVPTINSDHTKAQTRLSARDQSNIHTPVDTVAIKQDMNKNVDAMAKIGKLRETDVNNKEYGNVEVEDKATDYYSNKYGQDKATLDSARTKKIKAVP